jgi:probable phosphoglycerate mutase
VLPGTYNPYGDFLVPFGGDSEDDVTERMRSTLSEIMERPGHDNVLAVSHGACTRAFIASCDATSTLHVPNRVSKNCSIHVLHYANGEFDLIERFEPDDTALR